MKNRRIWLAFWNIAPICAYNMQLSRHHDQNLLNFFLNPLVHTTILKDKKQIKKPSVYKTDTGFTYTSSTKITEEDKIDPHILNVCT